MSGIPVHDAAFNFADRWPVPPVWPQAVLGAPCIAMRALGGLHQILVSGRIDKAALSLCPGAVEVGLWGLAAADRILVRVARDRALIVAASPVTVSEGWNPEGWCATVMSDAYRIFEIGGPRLADLVGGAVSADFRKGSPSAAVQFANIEALLYRTGETRARLHVEAPLAPYAWRWMEEQVRALGLSSGEAKGIE
jgi:hypothetical protein